MKKKVFCVLLCSVFIGVFLVPSFALTYVPTTTPEDLGDEVLLTSVPNGFYYIYIEPTTFSSGRILATINNRYFFEAGGSSGYLRVYNSTTIDTLLCKVLVKSQVPTGTYYSVDYISGGTYYLVVIASDNNSVNISSSNGTIVKLYKANTTSQQDLDLAYYQGYTNGFDVGFSDGMSNAITGTEQLNLVQHVNKAVGFFIGDEYAPYVTPFAIAFTLLLVYFIFIRWILLFGKSTKAMKIADIVVVAACIGIMAVLYINMFTINIHNTNVTESVYQIASDVVVGG